MHVIANFTIVPLGVGVSLSRYVAAVEPVLREGRGLVAVSGHLGVWDVLAALRRGEIAGLLADENAPRRPVFAPFLGTAAATRAASPVWVSPSPTTKSAPIMTTMGAAKPARASPVDTAPTATRATRESKATRSTRSRSAANRATVAPRISRTSVA